MLKMNHIGIVARDIDRYMKASFYPALSKHVFDPIQHSNIGLIEIAGQQPDIELIEPVGESATTFNFLKKTGGGYHHICYEIESEEVLDQFLRNNQIKKIYGPVKAILFDTKQVTFGYTRNREIVEFLILQRHINL